MVKKQASLHINGKRYDALTGNLLEHPIVPRRSSKSIDGVVGGKVAATNVTKAPSVAKPLPASQVPRAKAAHAKVHQTAPSATLMRRAVSKPTTSSIKRRAKAQTPVTHHPVVMHATATVMPKQSIHAVDHHRLARAQHINLSPRVSRFAKELAVEAISAVDDLEKALEAEPAVQYEPATIRVDAAHTNDIFEQALRRANSHEQVAPIIGKSKKAQSLRRQMAAFGAMALLVVAILGFLSYNSADARFERQTQGAGFSAVLPSYTPSGFNRSNVQTADGLVSTQYVRSSSLYGSGSFALTQKATDWDSQTLLNQIVTGDKNTTYSAIKTPTTTVYVYGRNQAAWVYNGVLYQVLGNGLLNTNDFTQLASSL